MQKRHSDIYIIYYVSLRREVRYNVTHYTLYRYTIQALHYGENCPRNPSRSINSKT